MKILLILAMCSVVYGADLKSRVDALSMVSKAKNIVFVKYDPFSRGSTLVEKIIAKKKQDESLYINTIMNNRVFINSSWYKVGDEVGKYKILQINDTNILAKDGQKIVKFGLKKSNKIIKVRNKE